MDVGASFGAWLKRRRRQLDLTQGTLAEKVGCSIATIQKIEADERRPSHQIAELLAVVLEIPPADRTTFVRTARGELRVDRLSEVTPTAVVTLPATTPRAVSNLPIPPTPLVGREAELTALARLLHDPQCHLITLIGAGGFGKTRLAIEAATRQADDFSGGAYFVSLASLSSPAILPLAIADALGLKFQGQIEPRVQLLNHLLDKCLLVLDNFEHLLSGADLLGEIMQCVSDVKLLVTSRERLNLSGEWVFEIQGLPVPTAEQAERLTENSAMQLFEQCALRVHGHFTPDHDEYTAVARVCQLVEGMPLGIELAAAWVRVLSCQEIVREIESNLDFLTTAARHVPERHRSLRAVFEHSWNLLPPAERELLRQLAVFHGGFRREAAEQVAGATLPNLMALVDKSLVHRTQSGRYDLHEVVRQFALAHLAEDPRGEAAAHERHSEFYLGLVKAREKAARGATQAETMRELTDEIDNIRAAWDWAVTHKAFGAIGPALRCFAWFCDMRGWLREGIERVELVVQALRDSAGDRDRQVLGQALAQQGLLFEFQGQFSQAQTLYEESLAILRSIGDPLLLIDPLIHYGIVMYVMGEIDLAQTFVSEGLACARTAKDEWSSAYGFCNQGYISAMLGRYTDGYEQILAGLAIWRALGDSRATALGLNWLSLTAIQLGRHEEALAFLQESLARSTEVGDRWGTGTAYRNLGLAAMVHGDLTEAQFYLRKSLERFTELGTRWDIAQTLIYLGETTAASGNSNEAERILGEALKLALDSNATPLALDALLGLARLKADAGQVKRACELASYVAGHAASVQPTRDRARQWRTQWETQLAPEQIAGIRAQARRTSLAALAAELMAAERGARTTSDLTGLRDL